jgi:hypothetical protein
MNVRLGILRTGERGAILIDACRHRQLTNREAAQLVSDERFPELFAQLCQDFVAKNSR